MVEKDNLAQSRGDAEKGKSLSQRRKVARVRKGRPLVFQLAKEPTHSFSNLFPLRSFASSRLCEMLLSFRPALRLVAVKGKSLAQRRKGAKERKERLLVIGNAGQLTDSLLNFFPLRPFASSRLCETLLSFRPFSAPLRLCARNSFPGHPS